MVCYWGVIAMYKFYQNKFFPYALQLDYEASLSWPDGGVDVDDEVFVAFQTPPAGKVRVVGIDGHPAWADIPPPTHDELVAQAEATRSSLLDEANGVIADWRTELALGIISDGDKVKLIAWMEYIKALKAVDTSTVPNISWPAPPEA